MNAICISGRQEWCFVHLAADSFPKSAHFPAARQLPCLSGKADSCTVFPEMQIAFIVDKVDRFFYLLHQHPPSNSTEAAKGANALMKNKIIGVCPNCGKPVVEREKGW